jgi:hypothetical protein
VSIAKCKTRVVRRRPQNPLRTIVILWCFSGPVGSRLPTGDRPRTIPPLRSAAAIAGAALPSLLESGNIQGESLSEREV